MSPKVFIDGERRRFRKSVPADGAQHHVVMVWGRRPWKRRRTFVAKIKVAKSLKTRSIRFRHPARLWRPQ